MKMIIIANAHKTKNIEVEDLTQIKLTYGKVRDNNYIELDNGIWLKSCGDGRLHRTDSENELWAEVYDAEFDEDGNFDQGELLGYIRV